MGDRVSPILKTPKLMRIPVTSYISSSSVYAFSKVGEDTDPATSEETPCMNFLWRVPGEMVWVWKAL